MADYPCKYPEECADKFDRLEGKIDELSRALQELWKNGLSALDRRVTIAEEQHKRTVESYSTIASIEKEQSGLRTAVTQHGVMLRGLLWIGGLLTATTLTLVGKALLDALTR